MLKIAQEAALKAGKILKVNYGKVLQSQIREKRKNDFLTHVDELSEQQVIETIHQHYPEHTILAEESGMQQRTSSYRWIIDPLDGTKNYICGIPIFAVSIALEYQNDIIMGVIYDPLRDDMFYAETGKGAYLNNKRINVSEKKELTQSLVATGFPFRFKDYLGTYMKCFQDIFEASSGARRLGAASVDLAYTAAGKYEGFWELGLSPWDMAAGALLVREAGGKVTDFWDNPDFLFRGYIIASNGKIHSRIAGLIQKHFSEYVPIREG